MVFRSRRPPKDAAAGMTLVEVLMALGLVVLVGGGAAIVMTRINSGSKHMQYRQDVSELRNLLRRGVDCGATIAAANCNGSASVTVIGTNGRRLVGQPPANVVGKLAVQATCSNKTLVVNASIPNVKDPQTGKALDFAIFDVGDGLCAGPASSPPIVIKDVLLQQIGPTPPGPILVRKNFAVTGYCPPGYQAIGAAPQCQFPSVVNPDCCGGRTVSNFPVTSGALSGYAAACAVIWDVQNGDIIQNQSIVCFRRARSGRLDND